MSGFRLVAVAGNTHRPSKSRLLADTIIETLRLDDRFDTKIYDIVDAGPGLGSAFQRDKLSESAAHIVNEIEGAEALIVAVPVYKGSYPGLFKHLIDFVDPIALVGKPVILAATGGGPRHALIVEHQLRPLFGFFNALSLPTAVYATDADYADGRVVDPGVLQRIAAVAGEFHEFVEPRLRTRAREAVA
jgi:FMN reductase